jgi:hypothetical protein
MAVGSWHLLLPTSRNASIFDIMFKQSSKITSLLHLHNDQVLHEPKKFIAIKVRWIGHDAVQWKAFLFMLER